ncbi:MAG: hypothetical protein IIA89_13390 [Chloroflexi bacterium]|nr:hypothetical protein [Chloroflexota bacterium]
MDDAQRITKALAPLTSVFPNWKGTPETVSVYVRILADLPPELLEMAIVQLLSQDREFMPTPGTIRETALQLEDYASGRLSAPEAWGEAMRLIRGVGSARLDQEGSGDDTLDQAMRAVGGWRAVGYSDNPTADRARFIEAYSTIDRREREERRMLPAVREHIAQLADSMSVKALSLPVTRVLEVVDSGGGE